VAGAVAIFARNEDRAVIDANVVRVLCRYFGIRQSDSVRRAESFGRLASAMVPPGRARTYTWALLDLGALVCTPAVPRCDECPLSRRCEFKRRRPPPGRKETSIPPRARS
jgi:A/G-specific adenine glycosylase